MSVSGATFLDRPLTEHHLLCVDGYQSDCSKWAWTSLHQGQSYQITGWKVFKGRLMYRVSIYGQMFWRESRFRLIEGDYVH